MRSPRSGGGWPAILYALRQGRRSGGVWRMLRALRSRNACKTCALGMGGQLGGMVNEEGRWPEVCKKSIQAMAADLQGRIHPDFFRDFSLDALRAFSPHDLEHAGRLVEPMYAGPLDLNYRAITWDEAMDRIVRRLGGTTPDESFFYFSGRSSNEAAFLLQLLARLSGTNNVNNCSYYCHQASGVALAEATGSGTASIVLEDIERSALLFVIGGNPASNHPRLMRSILNLRRRGGRVVMVNPLREVGLENFRVPSDPMSLLFGSRMADEYVQPHIGGDIAFLTGVARAVVDAGGHDRVFLAAHTSGSDEWLAALMEVPWERIERQSGVDRETIERVAALYMAAPSAIFAWTMGMTHHVFGVDNVRAIINLALLRGMVGRPHAGLLPLRGHSNVQGVGSMGVTPTLRDAVFRRLESHFGVRLPTSPGLDTMGCIERAAEGRIRFALCLGGNLFGSNPDAAYASRALGAIDQVVYLSTSLNTGHACGRGRETIILPVLARDEEHEATTQESMFNFVRLSDGGPSRHGDVPGGGPRSEVDVVTDLARRLLAVDRLDAANGAIDWQAMRSHAAIRAAIARIIPGYEQVGEIDRTRREFQIAGRTFHEPRFHTPDGRARMNPVSLPPPLIDHAAPGERLVLMTIRSEGQFNTVVYEEEDSYRGQERRDVILMAAEDIDRLGLRIDQRVTVKGPAGAMHGILVRKIPIRPGNCAMYYPEANMLIPRTIDPRSRTPAFKSVVVQVLAGSPGAADALPAGAHRATGG